MSIRQTRLEYKTERSRLRAPTVSPSEFLTRVKRLMKRRMLADGVVEPKSEPTWYYEIDDPTGHVVGHVYGHTRGEARSEIKKLHGLKRLPADLILTKETLNADSTRSAVAA